MTNAAGWTLRDDLQLMAEIAVSASVRGLGSRATPVVQAIAHFAPDHAAPAICRALTALGAGDTSQAVAMLETATRTAHRGTDATRGLMLLALVMAERMTEARELHQTLMGGSSGAVRRLAESLEPLLAPGMQNDEQREREIIA